MALTTQPVFIGGATKSLLGAQDGSGNVAPAHVLVDGSGAEKGTSGNPIAVQAASLPLPAGAATAANQPALHADGGALAHVTNLPATQPVSLSALPTLPSGSNTIGAVTGATAVGSPPANPPLSVSGVDGSGNKQHLKVATDGTIQVSDTSYATHAPAYYQASLTTAATLATLIGTIIPSWATMAFVTPETGAIRYRADGTDPTTSVGQPVAQSQSWPIQGPAALAAAKLIAQSGSVTVSIEFRG